MCCEFIRELPTGAPEFGRDMYNDENKQDEVSLKPMGKR